MMKLSRSIFVAVWLLPAGVSAQDVPVDRLSEVLPADQVTRVLDAIESARASALPSDAVTNLALEGVAKGRSGEEVVVAVESLVGELTRARAALDQAGRTAGSGEIEAATAAMRMGVDASAISELARSQPSGRSLAVPMLVMAGLADRGLPSDEALARVAGRLAAQADDAALVRDFPEAVPGVARGAMPAQAGPELAAGMAGFQVPVGGINVPVGPPSEIGDGLGRRPGPGDVQGPGGRPGPGGVPPR